MKFKLPGVLRPGGDRSSGGGLRSRAGIFPSRQFALVFSAVLLAAIAGGAGTNLFVQENNDLPSDVAFRAEGVTMTKEQLQHRIVLMEFLYGLQQPTDAAKQDKFRRDVAKALAVSQVIDTAARERGIVIADKEASDQLQRMIKDNSWGDNSTLIQQLGSHGLSEDDVLGEIQRQQSSAELFFKVTESVKATTDAQAQSYYNAHKSQMVSPEQRTLDNIVVSSQSQAEQIVEQARAGGDFAALAQKYSLDGSTKNSGGSLGSVTASQLDSGYAAVAFKAADNSVFGPVKTTQGWNVGMVAAVQKAVPLSFSQLKSAIETKLDNDAKLKVWDAFLKKQIIAAHVRYAAAYEPADPDSPPATNTVS
ncbi:peptidylprolyl isomerase [Streptomyces sp. RB6PN25]|uniref:Peptidylprolyl isomerase n=1 Tax=Streptomyces humicola TaxID=2953240 RepID=A0ABT1PW97_9ACTN|nr:peptidyl-prolyl cis-trans isomerase [Streptomyces humicola]MCQ4080810.1 peptidylprolyl isomerase [Streptomyces humicola]